MIGDNILKYITNLNSSGFMTVDSNTLYDLRRLLHIRDWALTQLPLKVGDRVALSPHYSPRGDFRGKLEAGMLGTVAEVYFDAGTTGHWRATFTSDHNGCTYASVLMEELVKLLDPQLFDLNTAEVGDTFYWCSPGDVGGKCVVTGRGEDDATRPGAPLYWRRVDDTAGTRHRMFELRFDKVILVHSLVRAEK